MIARDAVDQLCGDAHAAARLAHAAFQHVGHAELARHLRNPHILVLEGERRIARDHGQRRDLAEIGDDVFADAIAEIFLLDVSAHIGEGQNADRVLARRPFFMIGDRGFLHGARRKHMHRRFDILDRVFAHVVEFAGDFAPHLIAHDARERHAADRRERLDTRSDIDAFAIDVVALDDHLAQIDADSIWMPPSLFSVAS